jgi:hypothetical protein
MTAFVVDAPVRDPALRAARIHLRTGSLALARAELESLAGTAGLDDEGLLDLAEVRWRTGDLSGAGEAANAYLAAGRATALALAIAAEATIALGRPSEARRLVGRALEAADGSLEPLFAGMPRSPIWPHDPGIAAEHVGTLFPDDRSGAGPRTIETAPGLWDRHAGHAGPAVGLADPTTLLEDGHLALAAGDTRGAAVRFALALRAAPAMAPAVLDALAGSGGPVVELVRGEAYRAAGHEADAMRAYAAAAAALAAGRDDGARIKEES